MQTLNAKTVALTGTNLIEASAGTGKTWTISWLYLRLVAVYDLKVDTILVVTYTEAATAELRDRIRKRLADALAYLEERPHEETYAELLIETPLHDCIQRLQLALVSFDEAAVFTIHGFCKRVLSENAFEARLPFESELVANEDALLTELTDKFWYQHFLKPDPLHLMLLQKRGVTPDSLLADVRNFIGKPYLQEEHVTVTSADFTAVNTALLAQLSVCSTIWQADGATIRQLLRDALAAKVLNGASYKADKLNDWFALLDALFANGFTGKGEETTLEKFTTSYLKVKINKGKQPPAHRFFDSSEQLLALRQPVEDMLPLALEQVRLALLHHLRHELPIRKQQLGLLTFDDLLLHLREAVTQHPALAARLATKYQAALIDEFQDTDPIQYEIFERIYRNSPDQPVFYVGDPKQAIYGFRGADIYTYLKAAQATCYHHTLKHNFRSHPALLTALNHLFAQSDQPFRSDISYEAVAAGKPQSDLLVAPPLSPIRLWDWDSLDEGNNSTTVQAGIASAVANDIARLLNAARQGAARIGERPVCSSDIAVLVRENRQGELVKQALLERGIASVQKSRDSIFCTREASEFRAVLRAIAEPGNESALKQALVTELFGFTAQRLFELDENPTLLERELEAFHRWHKTWHTQGFMPMFRQWMLQRGHYAHLLALVDGERRLTNLLHLAELIHTESRLQGHGMHALIRWLQQKAEAAEKDEAHELRLESDENLVQITTIHKSKGLEYGIVYCPYLWLERDPKASTWFSWYDADTEEGVSRLQAEAFASDAARQRFREAEQAENLRLLYVAVTRAKYHCTIALVSGRIPAPFSYYSALGWLLFGKLAQGHEILSKLRKDGMQPDVRQALMHAQLQQVVKQSDGCISHESMPVDDALISYQPETGEWQSSIRRYQPRYTPVPKVGSFSGLASGKEDERPDYDTLAWQTPVVHETLRTAFPRGAKAGSCLHKMLEELDFTQPLAEQRDKVLLPALKRHGLPERWREAGEQLLEKTLHTSLGAIVLCLADLPKTQRLDELEFYFPVERLRLKPLQALLHQHLPAEWTLIHAAVDKLKFNDLTGYLKGYIDLVFAADGQYFVVDYKSNELGTTPADYTHEAMQQAMAEHHYYLQYLIYCLALHRYLQQRQPHYAWEKHVGGALYLFLRGMTPEQAGSGVFFHKPDWQLIEVLDHLIQ
ncbi:exodeoxyribonuclease V subunit beta [Thiothrix fructosivorans]|uniref:RecBCD enzyme subunit RecB n=1 Tax=Thiothrix fructosivorans TaxID=111770 RepID=A0A8B0SGD3_9GAMM|nr:exodeoxyribonuclease V subunit beta [Thiothrix fructosivorans]MBO0615100.1 exodeoxyribonuclease V subunit beta [Thiothrix fructosivorans]QTX09895.1 exodeoxyribonuclease V subunit beta [Thiothrix fructosivorans]